MLMAKAHLPGRYLSGFSPQQHFFTPAVNSTYYYYYNSKFFTPAQADFLSLEFEWKHSSLSLQDFSQYSSRSKQCCSWDGVNPIFISSNALTKFLWLVPRVKLKWVWTSASCNIRFLSCLPKFKYLSLFFFVAFEYHHFVRRDGKLYYSTVFFFVFFFFHLLIITMPGLLAGTRWFVFFSKSQKNSRE